MTRRGRTVIVTGASRGIGEAAVRRFSRDGFRVIGIARSAEALERLKVELGRDFVPIVADLGDLEEAQRTITSLLEREGSKIGGLVLNAGVSANQLFHESSRESREQEMNLNYHSPAIFLQRTLESFAKRTDKGRVVVVGSLTALIPFPGNAGYSASKAAFFHLLRSVRLEQKGGNVEISAVLPGLTRTEMSAHFETLLPRTSPETVANAIVACWSKPEFPKLVGPLNRLIHTLNRLEPSVFDQAVVALQRWIPHA
jgi:short-subunit dehydrogenase